MIDLVNAENWDTPMFPVAVAAQAAAVDVGTLRQWITRYGDDLRLWEPKTAGAFALGARASKDGLAHLFTLRGVLHIAAAARLIAKGVPVKTAYTATMHWAHIGTPDRLPCGLYSNPAWTFLIHHSGDDARVVSVTPTAGKMPFDFSDLFATGYPIPTAPTIVFLNKVDLYARGVCEGFLRD